MKRIILLAIVFFPSFGVSAYEGEPVEQVDSFFLDMAEGKVDQAIDGLYASNPAMQQKLQALALMKQQMGSVEPLYGKHLGIEIVSEENISDSVARILVIDKHEAHPLIWEFYFYKPKETWMISQALMVDQFQLLGSKK